MAVYLIPSEGVSLGIWNDQTKFDPEFTFDKDEDYWISLVFMPSADGILELKALKELARTAIGRLDV